MRRIRTLVALGLLGLMGLVNVRLHRPGGTHEAAAQLRFLEETLDQGAAGRMQQWFPEGLVFTWALYGVACAQVAQAGDLPAGQRTHLLTQARRAVREVRTEEARATFPTELSPQRGAFYSSWALYVLAEYVRAIGQEDVEPELLDLLRQEAEAFATALQGSVNPFLPSYVGLRWPADTAVGVAALGIVDQVLGARYSSVIEDWVAAARERLNPELGALTHSARRGGGDGVRGSSLALMSRVLVDADEEFAREQYEILRDEFAAYRLGMPGILEYPRGTDGGGDIDSGPIILGYSGPAIVVGAAAARVHGDRAMARVLLGGVEVGGMPLHWRGERRYAGGLVPVGDAFIAWARSSPAQDEAGWPRVIPRLWALPFHLASLLASLLIAWLGRLLPRRPARPSAGRQI